MSPTTGNGRQECALSEWYFRLRPFELRASDRFYRWLGVRIYKKYVPTSGDLVTRLSGKNRLKVAEAGSRERALRAYVNQTKAWELRHLFAGLFVLGVSVVCGYWYGIHHLWFLSILNLLVNVYPILVQRYNRSRIVRVLDVLAERQARSDDAAEHTIGNLTNG